MPVKTMLHPSPEFCREVHSYTDHVSGCGLRPGHAGPHAFTLDHDCPACGTEHGVCPHCGTTHGDTHATGCVHNRPATPASEDSATTDYVVVRANGDMVVVSDPETDFAVYLSPAQARALSPNLCAAADAADAFARAARVKGLRARVAAMSHDEREELRRILTVNPDGCRGCGARPGDSCDADCK